MRIPRSIVVALAGILTTALGLGSAAAEQKAKVNSGMVGIKRSQDKFKERLDDHVKKQLTCSVTSAAIGQYSLSPIGGVKGQFVGCYAPKPVCFQANEKLEDGRKAFITAVNSRWGAKEDVNQVLPTVPECAIPTDKGQVFLKVDSDQVLTDVKATVDVKFDFKYINSQKLAFGKNNNFPVFDNGTTYPRGNGEVITSYVNYDRSVSFVCNVEYKATVTKVDVDLSLDYAQTNAHYCESTLVIADQPAAIDCPKK